MPNPPDAAFDAGGGFTAPLVPDESPLRKFPDGMDVTQQIFLDGIVGTLQAIWIAYARLSSLLLDSARARDDDYKVRYAKHLRATLAFMEAWTIIDSSHRLRTLVGAMPGVRRRSPSVVLLVRKLSIVQPLRNGYQHLDGTISAMKEGGMSQGALLWTYVGMSPTAMVVRSCVMVSTVRKPKGGTESVTARDLSAPRIEVPIGQITLVALGAEVPLSDLVQATRRFAREFETGLAKAFASSPTDLDSHRFVIVPVATQDQD